MSHIYSQKINCGDDFYSFVNEHWLEKTDIPNDHSSWGVFQEIENKTLNRIKKLLESTKIKNKHKVLQIIYNQSKNYKLRNCDENKIQVNKIISKILNQESVSELFNSMSKYFIEYSFDFPVVFSVEPDLENSSINILHLWSGGLGLGNSEFYLSGFKDPVQEKYMEFIYNYGLLFNVILNSKKIFNLEKKLASRSYNKTQSQNITFIKNSDTFENFILVNPNLLFLNKIFKKSRKNPGKINVSNPQYMIWLNNLMDSEDLETWKQYFIFHIILEFNCYLSKQIESEYFNFYSKILRGINKMKPKWLRSIVLVDSIMSNLLGILYVEKYFDTKSKKQVLQMVKFIKNELKIQLNNATWLENKTKSHALEKLKMMGIKIGYPKRIIQNYNLVKVSKLIPLVDNILLVKKYNCELELSKLYRPVDKSIWHMGAHSVNAYYSQNMNEIVFPAGILQKPFFSLDQDLGYNFGGIGMVIGHEITHGFDNNGSKYDAYGNLSNWWTKNDNKKYLIKKNKIKDQYNKYTINGFYSNVELTLGENIADIGGLELSYNALVRYLGNINETDNLILEKKKFFTNFANIWKSKIRDEEINRKILFDEHTIPIFRVNGTIRNINDFYSIFNIEPNDKLYLNPKDRIGFWT